MDIKVLVDILVMIAPSLTAFATIIGGIVYFVKNSNKTIQKSSKEFTEKNNQMSKDIGIMKTKIASIEKYLTNKEKK